MTNRRRNGMLTGIAGGALALAVVGVAIYPSTSRAADQTVQFDQDAPATPTSPAKSSSLDYEEALAAALGITEDELEAAQEAAAKAALDQAVADGALTQSQADQLLDRWDDDFPMGGRGGRGGLPRFAATDVDWDSLLADALGISVDDLDAARDQVYADSLAQAVSSERLTQEEADLAQARYDLMAYLQPKLEAAREQALQDAVADGIITQDQLDALQSDGFGAMRGGMFGVMSDGMHGGMPGGMRGGSFGDMDAGGWGGRGGHDGHGGPRFGADNSDDDDD